MPWERRPALSLTQELRGLWRSLPIFPGGRSPGSGWRRKVTGSLPVSVLCVLGTVARPLWALIPHPGGERLGQSGPQAARSHILPQTCLSVLRLAANSEELRNFL